MTARPLFVLGTSGLAREMMQLVSQIDPSGERWQIRGHIAETTDGDTGDLGRYAVAGDDAWLLSSGLEADVVMGIGHPRMRATLARRYAQAADQFKFPNLVHPTAILDTREVQMGQGNAITAGCVLTVGISMGDFNLINWVSTLGHGVRIGNCNVVNPGTSLSGDVALGDEVLVGTGARILEGRSVGSGARVGAGAVVTSDVEEGMTVVGVPARPLRPRDAEIG